MRRLAPVIAVAALALPVVSAAGETKPAPKQRVAPIANTTLGKTKDGLVCKQVLRTGSRLGGTKICKTREEWDVITQDARQATERRQIFMSGDPSGGG